MAVTAVVAVGVFGHSPVQAEDGEPWIETTKIELEGNGTYNGSLVSVFTQNGGNTVVDIGGIRTSSIDASFNDNSGLVLVNQDTGNLNNQANIQSYVMGGLAEVAVVDLAVLGAHASSDNVTITQGGTRTNTISGSFQRSSGVVSVNQSAGSLNTQTNVFQLGLGLAKGPGAVALTDETLASVTAQNSGSEENTTSKRDVVSGNSFDNFSGVAQVTQSSGDQNAIRNTTTISVTVRTIK